MFHLQMTKISLWSFPNLWAMHVRVNGNTKPPLYIGVASSVFPYQPSCSDGVESCQDILVPIMAPRQGRL